jgi:hypothetical protein
MKIWADYMADADIANISQVTVGSLGIASKDITNAYQASGSCKNTPELDHESGMLSIAGSSKILQAPVKIVWTNQTRTLHLYTLVSDEDLVRKYAETAIRRSFGTENAMKLGKPEPVEINPVKFQENNVYIDSAAFFKWKSENSTTLQYEIRDTLPLREKTPVIYLYEDGVKTREYCLQTEGDEDFRGKFFNISVRLGMQGNPAVPIAQIDGFISDTAEDRNITLNDIGYRMEGHYLTCGGNSGKLRYKMSQGQDLIAKALKYPGYITPSNVRLMGICQNCGRSFCFHGYAFYMAQSDVAYSDDGLDCCEIQAYDIDKNNWSCEIDGKTFRYYNSFHCPHCGTPYIDYKKNPQNKIFGVSGCVHLGRKAYRAP